MTKSPPPRAGARAWAGLALLALPTLLLGLDVTVLYLVLPSMASALEPSATQELWIMDAYGFFIAGLLVTMGTIGDRIGRRRLLLMGMAAFAAVSVFAAFAPTASALVVARALLGVAGATLMPSTLALISNMFADPRQRAVAIGVWATMFALGMAAGPVAGGVLVDTFWWGAAFLVAIPIAIIVFAGAWVLLPEYANPDAGAIDLPSVALSLLTLLPTIYAVKNIAAYGVDATSTVLPAVGVAAGFAFVRRQRRVPNPLLDVSLFTNRAFSAALAILLVGLAGVGGSMFLVTQYLQLVEQMSPFVAGMWMGPPALAMFAAAISAPLLARRIRPGTVVGLLLGLSTLGYVLLASVGQANAPQVVTGFALVYLGLGAIAAFGTDIVVGTAPPAKAGAAAAMSETVQELGVAFGVAILGSLTTWFYTARIAPPAEVSANAAAQMRSGLGGAVAVAEQLPAGALQQAKDLFTSGMNLAALVAAIAIATTTVLSVVTLRHLRPLGDETSSPEPTQAP